MTSSPSISETNSSPRQRARRLQSALLDALDATPATRQQLVADFLADFSIVAGTRYAVGVASRADALRVALLAVDAKRGSEIITSSFGHASTPAAILQVGAVPRFVDVEHFRHTLDPMRMAAAFNDRTAGVIVTHQPGQPADMDLIMDIAAEQGIPVIEDVSAATGGSHDGVRLGAFGDLACFGFDAQSRLHATGDAGVIVTNSGDLANRIAQLVSPMAAAQHAPREIGWSSAIDVLQAAMLRVHLDYLDQLHDVTNRTTMAVLHQVPAFADRCIADELPNTMAMVNA